MATFRALQPARMDQEHALSPHGAPLLSQKPKRTVTLGACVACRKRKSKCDGNRPVCTCCAQKESECVYELGPNEKPSQAMKRKNEEMQGELAHLRRLYDCLLLRPEQDAIDILRRIRANPRDVTPSQSVQDIVRHGDQLIPPGSSQAFRHQSESADPLISLRLPPLRLALDSLDSDPRGVSSGLPYYRIPTMADGPSSQRRRHAADIDTSARSDSPASLPSRTSIGALLSEPERAVRSGSADPRLKAVGTWTSVTNDSGLLVLLLSVWHTWEYKYYHFLDWDIFLDDMASGQSEFCSSLLVNALLASASFQCGSIKDRSKPFSDNIMTGFYKEARRLWELEEGHDNLTRLQAALCIYMVLGKHGRDKVGHAFLVEACRIARDLGLFRLSPTAALRKSHRVPEERWEKVRAVTAWALFNFQLSMSFTYSFPALIQTQPPLLIPYNDTPDTEALFRSECSRHIIILDCAKLLADPDHEDADIPPKPEDVEILYLRLKSWWDSRPEVLDPTRFPSPENLLTAMQYYVTVNRLFYPFLNRESTLERVKSYRDRSVAVSSTSIKELRRLLVLHEQRHGWSNAIPYVLHPIMVTSFGSLEEIVREDHSTLSVEYTEPYQGLLICLRALHGLSSYVFYAQPLFRLLTQTCQTLDIKLPVEAMDTLDYYQGDEWTNSAASLMPPHPPNLRMDDVISLWSLLTLDGSGISSRVIARRLGQSTYDQG
ncbi:hypothetical protein BDV95DRAFT_668628 [Massariosphaeria phaeospora]|uniref:Zn(2)-C6 fungal-type domain-containing protein n=1 Tax=Massariosphaeria phaeospora TaxID=100035 RepID=A0A7C8MBI8_9PLEO|nr:hypothetical protein BDV95DRAFT_668628 [Massariosphaeria phaeospora]